MTAVRGGGTRARLGAKAIDQLMVAIAMWPAFGAALWAVQGESHLWMSWPYLFYFLLVPVAYDTISNWFFGRTVGKWVFSLRIVDHNHPQQVPSVGAFFVRAVAERLSFFFSWAVYALGWLRRDRRHFADWMAGTQVVNEDGSALQGPRRPVLALVVMVLFAVAGWETASRVAPLLQWDASGITLNF